MCEIRSRLRTLSGYIGRPSDPQITPLWDISFRLPFLFDSKRRKRCGICMHMHEKIQFPFEGYNAYQIVKLLLCWPVKVPQTVGGLAPVGLVAINVSPDELHSPELN